MIPEHREELDNACGYNIAELRTSRNDDTIVIIARCIGDRYAYMPNIIRANAKRQLLEDVLSTKIRIEQL